MTDLIVWILGVSGITLIVTKSYIFGFIRDLFYVNNEAMIEMDQGKPGYRFDQKARFYVWKLLNCPMCSGAWIGVILYFYPIEWMLYLGIGSLMSMAADRYIRG